MYCPSCNSYNDDAHRFCAFCGAPLQNEPAPQPDPAAYEAPQPDSGNNQQPPYQQPPYQQPYYQQPYPPVTEPTKPLSNVMSVIAIILSVMFFNIIGLVLAVLSLVNFNNYTTEKLRGSMELAESYKRKSKTLAIVSYVLTALELVLAVVLAIAVFGFVVYYGVERGGIDYSADFPMDFFSMIG